MKVDVSKLSAAHHEAARGWEDAELCLEMAADNEWTVKEMVAWRNVQKGTA